MPTQAMNNHETLTKPAVTKGETFILKDMNMLFYDDFPCFDEYQKTIKKSILEHGAIQSFIHIEPIDMEGVSQQTCQGIEYTDYRFMDKINHNLFIYETENLSTILCTHAIAITGWDDNRIIDIDGHTATGAWLVKDSMGSQYQDNGYFWVAYDDMVLGKIMAASLINYKGTDLQHPSCYQTHAGGLSQITSEDEFGEADIIELGKYSYLLNGFKDKDSWAFAKLTLDKPETVKGVAIFTANRNETVTVNVYKETESNEPLISHEFMIPEIGYHLLDFKEGIPFESQETVVFGIGFKASETQKYLPLVYVRSHEICRSIPTYFAYQENGLFTLTPYSEIGEDCTYYLQAVMAH